MSILSQMPDGYGFHYGFRDGDHRQINVRREADGWKAYVGGELIEGSYPALVAAEAAAYQWMDEHPVTENQLAPSLNTNTVIDALKSLFTPGDKATKPTPDQGRNR